MSASSTPCTADQPCKPCQMLAKPEIRRGDHQMWRILRTSFHRDRTAPSSAQTAVTP